MNVTGTADLKSGSLDTAVLVPCYDEGLGVLPTLASIAAQEGIEGRDVALVVVINNARHATAEVLASNRKTQALIDALTEGRVPTELLGGLGPFIHPLNKKRQTPEQLCQAILHARRRLITVDLWSEGHAPETCNVGVARDTGGQVALPFLREDGLLAWTDADSIMGPHYLATAFRLFEEDEKLGGARGPVIRFNKESEIRKNPGLTHADNITELETSIGQLFESLVRGTKYTTLQEFNGQAPSRENTKDWERLEGLPIAPNLPGSNTVTRARLFRDLGGIQHWAGAEDVEFGYRLLQGGWTTTWDKELAIATEYRISERTAEGHGMGFYVRERADYNGPYKDWKVASIDARLCQDWLKIQLDLLREVREQGKEIWGKTLIDNTGPPGWETPLANRELDRLWDADAYTSSGYSVRGNTLAMKEIQTMCRERHPDITIGAVLEQIRPAFKVMDERGGYYFTERVMESWNQIMSLHSNVRSDHSQLVEDMNVHFFHEEADALTLKTERENEDLFKEIHLARMLFRMDEEFRKKIHPFFRRTLNLIEWIQSRPEERRPNEFLAVLKIKLGEMGKHYKVLIETRMASIVCKNVDVWIKKIADEYFSLPDIEVIKKAFGDAWCRGEDPQKSYQAFLGRVAHDVEWLKERTRPYADIREQLEDLDNVIALVESDQPDAHNPAAPGSGPWIKDYKQTIRDILDQMDKVEDVLRSDEVFAP